MEGLERSAVLEQVFNNARITHGCNFGSGDQKHGSIVWGHISDGTSKEQTQEKRLMRGWISIFQGEKVDARMDFNFSRRWPPVRRTRRQTLGKKRLL